MTHEQLRNDGFRKYTGEKIDVYFNARICIHSGHCVKSNKELFNLERKPWILVDAVDVNTVKTIIDGCPSGALRYLEK